jgi:hypothetical protein
VSAITIPLLLFYICQKLKGENKMAKLLKIDGVYYFDAEDGSEPIACKTWVETSKKNEAHPEGKPWIVLPKGNVANRQYFSEEKFAAEAVNDEIVVEVKTSAPRVLGATGVKQEIIKYLDEATAAEYTELVTTAVEAYKEAKATAKRKRPEDMTLEELTAYVECLKNGTTYKAATTGPKSFLDMFTDEQYTRYNEILALAQENKANMPKAKRGPLTDEQKEARKIKRVQKEISKAQQLLAALKAGATNEAIVMDEDL